VTSSKTSMTLDVGIGYTVWTGIGSVGTVVLGTVIFDEPMNAWKALAFVLIIGGVLGLKLSDTLVKRRSSTHGDVTVVSATIR
jgi:Membrane transporters of cations and cationic drugs